MSYFTPIVAPGICAFSICTDEPDVTKIEAWANANYPTGIRSQWELSPAPTFATGQANPHKCPDRNGCMHYLLHC